MYCVNYSITFSRQSAHGKDETFNSTKCFDTYEEAREFVRGLGIGEDSITTVGKEG